MKIALLDCHKNRLYESEKIAGALKKEQPDVQVDLFEVRKFEFPTTECDALVISGADGFSTQHAWVRKTREFVETFLETKKPVLGVCYGSQLLGEIYGHEQVTLAKPEVGWMEVILTVNGRADPLFKDFPMGFTVFQHHARAVHIPIDHRDKILASNPACVQVVRYAHCVYGVQFHAEESPESGIAFLKTDPKCEDFIEATRLKPSEYIEWRVFKNFVELCHS